MKWDGMKRNENNSVCEKLKTMDYDLGFSIETKCRNEIVVGIITFPFASNAVHTSVN